jgi:hypothetical protein
MTSGPARSPSPTDRGSRSRRRRRRPGTEPECRAFCDPTDRSCPSRYPMAMHGTSPPNDPGPDGSSGSSPPRIRTSTFRDQSPACCRYTSDDQLVPYDSNVHLQASEACVLPLHQGRWKLLCADTGEVVLDGADDVEVGEDDDDIVLGEILDVEAGREHEGAPVEVQRRARGAGLHRRWPTVRDG